MESSTDEVRPAPQSIENRTTRLGQNESSEICESPAPSPGTTSEKDQNTDNDGTSAIEALNNHSSSTNTLSASKTISPSSEFESRENLQDSSSDSPTPITSSTQERSFNTSCALLEHSEEIPFLCGPEPVHESNILSWLLHGTSGEEKDENEIKKYYNHVSPETRKFKAKYQAKREELRTLATKIYMGGARIDEDGRLIPMVEPPRQQEQNLGNDNEEGDAQGRQQQEEQEDQANANQPENNNNLLPPPQPLPPLPPLNNNQNNPPRQAAPAPLPPLPPLLGFGGAIAAAAVVAAAQNGEDEIILEDEEIRQEIWARREDEAAEVIRLAVERYRKEGVNETDFEVVTVLPQEDEIHPMSFRRMGFIIFFIIAAVVMITLQTTSILNIDALSYLNFNKNANDDAKFDSLLYHLLEVQTFQKHLSSCGALDRSDADEGLSMIQRIFKGLSLINRTPNCAKGVLHIPSKAVLASLVANTTAQSASLLSPSSWSNIIPEFYKKDTSIYEPYQNGVNISWFHPCILRETPPSTCVLNRDYTKFNDTCSFDGSSTAQTTIKRNARENPPLSCFRGVHDGIVHDDEIDDILRLGGNLIHNREGMQGGKNKNTGGDHVQIHSNVQPLLENFPAVIEKLLNLLRSQYAVPLVKPVAFRVSSSLALDGSAYPLYRRSSQKKSQEKLDAKSRRNALLIDTINVTKQLQQEKKFRYNDEIWPLISLPPFIKTSPYPDPCMLMSDLEVNATYAFHTSVYLSDGAGDEYSGGAVLYADNHSSNSNPRKKIQRGVTIDGSKGRVVVSSGGDENMRCKFPTKSGVRAVLQIWWDCEGDPSEIDGDEDDEE